ncbi:MAG: TetR/AcrR family transcriptional regulator, partial [Pseudomonadota bacterium]
CDLWFGEGESAYDDIGFMLECFGEAVHDGEMRHTKSEFDRACKSYLVSLFPDDGASVGVSAEDASEISYALLIGLRNSVYFDRSMSLGDAARCFQEAVDRLRGI